MDDFSLSGRDLCSSESLEQLAWPFGLNAGEADIKLCNLVAGDLSVIPHGHFYVEPVLGATHLQASIAEGRIGEAKTEGLGGGHALHLKQGVAMQGSVLDCIGMGIEEGQISFVNGDGERQFPGR